MDQNSVTPLQRRKFLTIMLGGLGAVATAVSAWPVFRFLAPFGGGDASAKVEIAREKITIGSAHFFEYLGRPAVLLQPEAGQYIALSAVCTHLGCVVQWEADKGGFLCPCHGGSFAADGNVLSGPPPKALESLPVSLDGDLVLVG